MKAVIILLLGGALLTWLVGFDKHDDQPANASGESALMKAVYDFKAAAGRLGNEIKNTAKNVKDSAAQTFSEVKGKASSAAAVATATTQELIAKAKSMVSSRRFHDALNVIRDLGNYELTPEQQKIVDEMKTTVQKATASLSEGASAVGGFMSGSKQ